MSEITLENIRNQSWKNIYNIIVSKTTYQDLTVTSSYDKQDATFPRIVINPVTVNTSIYDIKGDSYDAFITVTLDIYTKKVSQIDELGDHIFNLIISNKDSLAADGMDITDFDDTTATVIIDGDKKLYYRAISFVFNSNL